MQLNRLIQALVFRDNVAGLTFKINSLPPTSAIEVIKGIAKRLKQPSRSQFYFIHELLPHYPYSLSAECDLRTPGEWRSRTDGPIELRRAAYRDQVACVTKLVGEVADAAGDDAIIIVHGDHGSRITRTDPGIETVGEFTDDDLVAAHSTLFAVRAPGIAAGYDDREVPVASVLAALVDSGFRSAEPELPAGFEPFIMLESPGWRPVRQYPYSSK